ncbi:hypothetical protein BH10PLA1_BH10PLA1_17760 [soil metagenome]
MNLNKRAIWAVTIVYWLAIFTLTHLPPSKLPPVPVNDKVEHMTAFGLLGIFLFAALQTTRLRRGQAVALLIAIVMFYAVVDELLQVPVGRTCDIHDIYADLAGLAMAVVMCVVIDWKGRRRERINLNVETPNPNE